MNNKSKIWSFLLVAIVAFLLFGTNVYAEDDDLPKKIRFFTTINSWQDNNDLTYNCGTASAPGGAITPTVYYATYDGMELGTYQKIDDCSFTLASLGWNNGDTYKIIEEYDFTNYVGLQLEFEDVAITPGKVTSNSFDEDDPIFESYEPSNSETAAVYNVNHVNETTGEITGEGLYVYHVSLRGDDPNEKESDKSFGTIYIPTYCVRLSFSARGNIASTYGTFVFDILGDQNNRITTGVTGGDNLPVTICEIDNEPLSMNDIAGIMNPNDGDLSYTGVNHADDYQMSVNSDQEDIIADGNTIIRPLQVVAYLQSDSSQTGLGYRIIPFLVLMGLMLSGYFVIRRNRIKE